MTSHIYDLIIIGSGPAGLAAAVYAQRACLDTLVIEQSTVSGGQILNTYEVDNYPGYPGISGYELGMKLREEFKPGRKICSRYFCQKCYFYKAVDPEAVVGYCRCAGWYGDPWNCYYFCCTGY